MKISEILDDSEAYWKERKTALVLLLVGFILGRWFPWIAYSAVLLYVAFILYREWKRRQTKTEFQNKDGKWEEVTIHPPKR